MNRPPWIVLGTSGTSEQSSLCYTIGPCWLSILYIVVCICQSQTPNLSLPPSPFGNHEFVSYACNFMLMIFIHSQRELLKSESSPFICWRKATSLPHFKCIFIHTQNHVSQFISSSPYKIILYPFHGWRN